ncbi:hypothetical protein ABZ921_22040 [Streptomyces atriruber]|uniref:Uncharacterized protein n=1 Tax=Streptomyces atriruber TaxID=545121 RepID=A0ABV3BQM8_9ACTN
MPYEGDDGSTGEGLPDPVEGRAPSAPSLWSAARRHAVLSVADMSGPLLLVLADWWTRTR